MSTRQILIVIAGVVFSFTAALTAGCNPLDLFGSTSDSGGTSTGTSEGAAGGGSLSSSTVLASSSLAGGGEAAQAAPAVSDTTEGLRITPTNVTGKVLSLLFPIDDKLDEGVVVFGNYRPDIAPADSELQDFDMAAQLAVGGMVNLKPDFGGGPSSAMILLFGYLDITFDLNGQTRTVRVALASVEGMQRGDVLLWFEDASGTGGAFRWYDLDSQSFVSERPDNPVVIAPIRDFFDPIRPDMVFYPISGSLTQPLDFSLGVFQNAVSMDVVLDFALSQFIILEDQHDPSAIDDATLIQSFNLSITSLGVDFSGLTVDAQVNFEYGQPPLVADANIPVDVNSPVPLGPNGVSEPNSSAEPNTSSNQRVP